MDRCITADFGKTNPSGHKLDAIVHHQCNRIAHHKPLAQCPLSNCINQPINQPASQPTNQTDNQQVRYQQTLIVDRGVIGTSTSACRVRYRYRYHCQTLVAFAIELSECQARNRAVRSIDKRNGRSVGTSSNRLLPHSNDRPVLRKRTKYQDIKRVGCSAVDRLLAWQ
jgi:hypothetical protein